MSLIKHNGYSSCEGNYRERREADQGTQFGRLPQSHLRMLRRFRRQRYPLNSQGHCCLSGRCSSNDTRFEASTFGTQISDVHTEEINSPGKELLYRAIEHLQDSVRQTDADEK